MRTLSVCRRALALLLLAGVCAPGCAQPRALLLPPDESPLAAPARPGASSSIGEAPAPRDGALHRTSADEPEAADEPAGPELAEAPAAAAAEDSAAEADPDEDTASNPPAFPDEVRLGQALDPFRPTRPRPMRDHGEDTDLSRPRAEREGEGGGPTRADEDKDEEDDEDEDEDDEDFVKPNLLVKALGLEDSPVKLFGWVEGSFTANPSRPNNGENFGLFPNSHANAWMFNQVYFVVERRIQEDNAFDYGFRFDSLLGTDWQVSHALGLFDGAFKPNRFGFDLPQAYGEIHLPILTPGGVDIKGGRFYALPGYEDLAAPGRPLLSTTYMFSYAQPITQIGAMSVWHVTDQINLYNGVTNGWDRWVNVHYKWGYAGAAAWDSKDGRTNVTLTLNWGPNQLPRFLPANFQETPTAVTSPPLLAGRRNLAAPGSRATLFTAVLTHDITEDLSTIIETNLGFENNVPGAGWGGTTRNASWYGLAGWFLYDVTDNLTGVARAEVFRDNNGILTDFSDNFYEATLGAIYKPRPWLWARPEIRYDWAQFTRPYNDGTSKNQLTLGFDIIFLF